jgi:chemotaxis protein MotA
MNRASVIGLIIGITAILGGNIIEGGRITSIVQGSAALIVFGGTFGATFLSFSMKDIMRAGRSLKRVFINDSSLPEAFFIIKDAVDLSTRARKNGILSLEKEIQNIRYDFFRRALRLVIDGVDPRLLRRTLEQETGSLEEDQGRAAKVFESAGGFAPTIGIIGAVLGLIHVMENLNNPADLGSGIAIAFVATVYGVGSANLLFLPIAKKIMNNLRQEIYLREIIIEGALGIQAGKNPYYLREYLNSFILKK